jgi:hypothetical protein
MREGGEARARGGAHGSVAERDAGPWQRRYSTAYRSGAVSPYRSDIYDRKRNGDHRSLRYLLGFPACLARAARVCSACREDGSAPGCCGGEAGLRKASNCDTCICLKGAFAASICVARLMFLFDCSRRRAGCLTICPPLIAFLMLLPVRRSVAWHLYIKGCTPQVAAQRMEIIRNVLHGIPALNALACTSQEFTHERSATAAWASLELNAVQHMETSA